MQSYKIAFYITGIFTSILSLLMFIPAFVEYFTGGENMDIFLNSAYFGIFISLLITATSYTKDATISHRSSFLATTIIWLAMIFIAAVPLYFSHYPGYEISIVDALFESSSGFTTTGASILTNLDSVSKGILLWRAMLQFFGGVGIITFVFIVIPYLQNGTMYFFLTESSENQGKETARIIDFAFLILSAYTIFTLLCTCLYYLFGMTLFDAICHAMATVSSGGFSTHDSSFADYNSYLQTVAIVFMVISAMPFIMIVRLFTRRKIIITTQTIILLCIFTSFSLILFLFYSLVFGQPFTVNHFKHIVFAVVSVGSSTGFYSENFSFYGGFFINLMLIVSIIGGCTGSTSGGIKVFRFQVMYSLVKFHFTRIANPDIVKKIKIDDQEITQQIITSVVILFIIYAIFAFISVLCVTAFGFSFADAISITISSLSNGGVLASEYGGSTSIIYDMPQFLRGLFAVLMILGRLEFTAVLIIIFQLLRKI